MTPGTPWLAYRLCFFLRPSEAVAKGLIEPGIAGAVGGGLIAAGAEAMGLYVMAAGGCLLVIQAVQRVRFAARAKHWRDKEWETEAFEAYLRRNYR